MIDDFEIQYYGKSPNGSMVRAISTIELAWSLCSYSLAFSRSLSVTYLPNSIFDATSIVNSFLEYILMAYETVELGLCKVVMFLLLPGIEL